MLVYDFWHMIKRLIPFYIFFFVLQALFRGIGRAFILIMLLGFLTTAAVNLNKFWNDYMGKNAVMINILPIGGFYKIFSKLLWGFIFFLLFTAADVFLAFGLRAVFITPLRLIWLIMFYLNCYTAMTAAKSAGRWYYIFFIMILLNAVAGLIGFGVYFFIGETASALIMGLMCIILLFTSAYCVEN